MKSKVTTWLLFALLILVWLTMTGINENPAEYKPKPYHNPDGEPVNVVEVMRNARGDGK